MNIILKLQLGSIRVLFQKIIVNIEHRYNPLFYTNLHNFVLRKCIQHIGKELERVKFVGTSKDDCGCFIRTIHGLPCACKLDDFQIQGKSCSLISNSCFLKEITH